MQGDGAGLHNLQKRAVMIGTTLKCKAAPAMGERFNCRKQVASDPMAFVLLAIVVLKMPVASLLWNKPLPLCLPDKRRNLYRLYDTLLYT